MRGTSLNVAVLAIALLATSALAQSLDPTPGTTPPIELDGSIGPGGDVPFDGTTWSIGDELGEYNSSGSSLFHSFGRFDVPGGETAEFGAAHGAPERVFARVTWGETSDIEGTLRSTIPGADLFVINPAGVRVAGGARLDVQGSFAATSAGRIGFADGESFSASAANPPPLLSVAEPSSYGFLPEGGGAIEVDVLDVAPLSVPRGETLALVGGEIDVFGGGRTVFSSPGSRIALVAAGPNVEVPIDVANFDPTAVPSEVLLGPVSLLGSRILASFPAGSVVVRGESLRVEGTTIGAIHNGADPAAFAEAIDIATRGSIDVLGRSTLNAGTTSAARGGDVVLSGDAISLSGDSEVLVATTGPGAGSELAVEADVLRIEDGARLRSESRSTGPGGAIDVEAGALFLATGGRILSEVTGAGPGGEVRIDAARIDATDAGFSASGTVIASTTAPVASGNAGSLAIDVDQISLRDGAQIFSSTSGTGNAGAVRILADRAEVSGIALDASGSLSRVSAIEARALPGSTGQAGETQPDASVLGVSIAARQLHVSDAAEISTSTQGAGAAGDLELRVGEAITLEGGSSGPARLLSRAIASEGTPVVGPGGDLRVATSQLSLLNGGQITASTSGTGDAGSVQIDADQVQIRGRAGANQSGVFAQTLAPPIPDAGSAGGVRIQTSGDIAMSDQALIAVETRNGGPAGSIEIDAGGRVSLDAAAISARASADSSAPSGSISIRAAEGVFLSNGSVVGSRSFGTDQAGTIFIDAGPRFEAEDSQVSTESLGTDNPGGGVIEIVADQQIILTDSFINTSVAAGGGDGGDVGIDPTLMVLNRSAILADALDGNGGHIFIRAGSFVISSDSLVRASSLGGGIDGTVVIESPESELNSERAQPAQEFLDAAGLLKTACGAGSGAGAASSFVVMQVAGLPASPEGPLPAPLWDALPSPGHARVEVTPMRAARPLRVAARAGGCEALEEL